MESEKRMVSPFEAEDAALHLKKAHEIKKDKDLHKAAKEHMKREHAKLGEVLGKGPSESEKMQMSDKGPAKAQEMKAKESGSKKAPKAKAEKKPAKKVAKKEEDKKESKIKAASSK